MEVLLSNKNCFVLLQTGAEVKTDTCLRWSTLLIFFIISKILIFLKQSKKKIIKEIEENDFFINNLDINNF